MPTWNNRNIYNAAHLMPTRNNRLWMILFFTPLICCVLELFLGELQPRTEQWCCQEKKEGRTELRKQTSWTSSEENYLPQHFLSPHLFELFGQDCLQRKRRVTKLFYTRNYSGRTKPLINTEFNINIFPVQTCVGYAGITAMQNQKI